MNYSDEEIDFLRKDWCEEVEGAFTKKVLKSKKRVILHCKEHNFSYQMGVKVRLSGSTRCRVCLGVVTPGVNDIRTLYPLL